LIESKLSSPERIKRAAELAKQPAQSVAKKHKKGQPKKVESKETSQPETKQGPSEPKKTGGNASDSWNAKGPWGEGWRGRGRGRGGSSEAPRGFQRGGNRGQNTRGSGRGYSRSTYISNPLDVTINVLEEDQEAEALDELRGVKRTSSEPKAGDAVFKKPKLSTSAEKVAEARIAGLKGALPKGLTGKVAEKCTAKFGRQIKKTADAFEALLGRIRELENRDVQPRDLSQKDTDTLLDILSVCATTTAEISSILKQRKESSSSQSASETDSRHESGSEPVGPSPSAGKKKKNKKKKKRDQSKRTDPSSQSQSQVVSRSVLTSTKTTSTPVMSPIRPPIQSKTVSGVSKLVTGTTSQEEPMEVVAPESQDPVPSTSSGLSQSVPGAVLADALKTVLRQAVPSTETSVQEEEGLTDIRLDFVPKRNRSKRVDTTETSSGVQVDPVAADSSFGNVTPKSTVSNFAELFGSPESGGPEKER